jgi:hypothetical protein
MTRLSRERVTAGDGIQTAAEEHLARRAEERRGA